MGFTSDDNVNGPRGSAGGISSQKSLGLASWEDILRQSLAGSDGLPSNASISSSQPATTGILGQELILSEIVGEDTGFNQLFDSSTALQPNWQVSYHL